MSEAEMGEAKLKLRIEIKLFEDGRLTTEAESVELDHGRLVMVGALERAKWVVMEEAKKAEGGH
jgi:hypothetical protein